MCIIVYTDYSDFSSYFTSTFRKIDPFEPIQSVIRRHQNVYWISKILQETVQNYGGSCSFIPHCGTGSGPDPYNYVIKGPFYCGMSSVMTLPEFAMQLLSPTSTSCHIEVAMKFTGDANGIIIEFSNERSMGLKALDVSWISRYKEEDERYVQLMIFVDINNTPFSFSGCFLDLASH